MLNDKLQFNYGSIRNFTEYSCEVDESTLEKEISFCLTIGPSNERKGDCFPVYKVPEGKMLWLSDWSFNSGGPLNRAVSIGGSLGRITGASQYVYVLNCSVSAGEMEIYSPSKAIRYVEGEWISVCFHHMGEPMDILMRATFRFTEVPSPKASFETDVFEWNAKDKDDTFKGQG